jgi:hypothetical protein
MAELTTVEADAATCCSPAAQKSCCEPEAKAGCCDESHGVGCGCSAGKAPDTEDVRELVRERYGAAALAASAASATCCDDAAVITDEQRAVFGSGLYETSPPRDDSSPVLRAGRLLGVVVV